MGLYDCKIIRKHYLTKDQFLFDLKSSDITAACGPGQFVDILCDGLLRRPISICGVDRENGIFQVAIRVKGAGTAFLEKKNVGESLSVLGPLGKGFDLANTRSCVVVGGGIGIFPLLFVLSEAKKRGIPTTAVCGFRSKEESFCIDEVRMLSDQVVFASDCGDLDVCGNAVDALENVSLDDSEIFTCGPVPMMREAARVAEKKGIRCQASLEERMGCGTGICLVCACRVHTPSGDFEYKRCCKDGPVFDAKEVAWESM